MYSHYYSAFTPNPREGSRYVRDFRTYIQGISTFNPKNSIDN